MNGKLGFIALIFLFLSGCASVPMQSAEQSNALKQFNPPGNGNAGLYIFRSGGMGTALKKNIWVDGTCVGESAPNVFFYLEVEGNKEHKISTESEFSPNDLVIKTDGGKNYFIEQYIKMGVFVGGAGLEVVDEEKGKKEISTLNLAKNGTCGK